MDLRAVKAKWEFWKVLFFGLKLQKNRHCSDINSSINLILGLFWILGDFHYAIGQIS